MDGRRWSLVTGVMVALLTTGAAQATASRSAPTDVEGTVLAEAPTPEAVACAWQQGGDAAQGVLGWVVELQPGEGDGTHTYTLWTGGAQSELDLAFYAELPTCGTEPTLDPLRRDLDGTVPSGSRWAVLGHWTAEFTYAGWAPIHPHVAVAATFRFKVENRDGTPGFAAFESGATLTEVPAGRPGLPVALSRARFGPGDAAHAVLTRMDVFVDSLAGTPLAAEGPMLGVWPDRLPADVVTELRRALPEGGTVYLLGGPQAISDEVVQEVESIGYVTRRLAGPSRVQTALAVADEVRRLYPEGDEVGLARDHGRTPGDTAAWADSVAGGGWAAHRRVPILVTPGEHLHPDVAAWLDRDEPSRTVLLGGEHALSSAVEEASPEPFRVGGADRAETAALIARDLWGASGDSTRRHVVVHGWAELGWLWGLPAAGVAADHGAPVLLVSGEEVPPATADLVASCGRTHLVVSGTSPDTATGVGDAVLDELRRLARDEC